MPPEAKGNGSPTITLHVAKGCQDSQTFCQLMGVRFSIEPPKGKLLAGEQKATEIKVAIKRERERKRKKEIKKERKKEDKKIRPMVWGRPL